MYTEHHYHYIFLNEQICNTFDFVSFTKMQITRIEYVHAKGFLHRDVKPDNFLMGLGRKANVVIIIVIHSSFNV